jgi:hypothetical protein
MMRFYEAYVRSDADGRRTNSSPRDPRSRQKAAASTSAEGDHAAAAEVKRRRIEGCAAADCDPPQPENPTDHSPITESSRDPETVSNASEKVADEVLVTHREPIVGARNPTKYPATEDELVGRAIGMIRSALKNGSA